MSKEEAIKVMFYIKNYFWNDPLVNSAVDMAIEALSDVPKKTGKWMTPKQYCQYLYETTGERCTPMATGLESFVYCSQCGEPSWFSTNYCQHCGARMESKE